MNYRVLILALALPALAAAQTPPTKFNLVCTLKERFTIYENKLTNHDLDLSGIDKPFGLRIDTSSKSWCREPNCPYIDMLEATPTTLELIQGDRTIFTPINFTINRVTGQFIQSFYMRGEGGPILTTDGYCKPAPFKPFPKAIF